MDMEQLDRVLVLEARIDKLWEYIREENSLDQKELYHDEIEAWQDEIDYIKETR